MAYNSLKMLGKAPDFDAFKSFQQGQEFVGQRQLADSLSGASDVDPMAVYGSYNPEAAFKAQYALDNKTSSGVTGNMQMKMLLEEQDKPIRKKIAKLQGDMAQYAVENPGATLANDANMARMYGEIQSLNAGLNSPQSGRDLVRTTNAAMEERKQAQSEKQFEWKVSEDQQDDVWKIITAVTQASRQQMAKMKDVPAQAEKVARLLSKPSITYAQAGAATKITIQSLDNSAVMGNEITSLSPDDLRSEVGRIISRVFGGGSIRPEDLRGIHNVMLDISEGYNEFLKRVLEQAQRSISSGAQGFGASSEGLATDNEELLRGFLGVKSIYPTDYVVQEITGNPDDFVREVRSETGIDAQDSRRKTSNAPTGPGPGIAVPQADAKGSASLEDF